MSELAPYPPEDMAEFWQETVQQAMDAPLDAVRSRQDEQMRRGFQIDLLRFRGIDGQELHGWIAVPEGVHHGPGFLWLAPYSRWSMMPNEYGTRDGYVSLSFNFFGESAFHDETYTPARGYFAEGAEDPETWVFRRMLQNAVIAARIMHAQVEVDETKIASMGMSQGGGMSIWLAAWCPLIKAVCADMPFLGGMPWALSNRVYRYPLKELTDYMGSIPLGQERVMHTISYYDTLNQATFCEKPTLVTLGLKDPAVRPEQVRAIYEALPGEKVIEELDWGHDWHPSMVDRNKDWLDRWL